MPDEANKLQRREVRRADRAARRALRRAEWGAARARLGSPSAPPKHRIDEAEGLELLADLDELVAAGRDLVVGGATLDEVIAFARAAGEFVADLWRAWRD